MKCMMCLSGLPLACTGPPCETATRSEQVEEPTTIESEADENSSDSSSSGSRFGSRNAGSRISSVRSNKRDAVLKDQQSTGRKRAARMYPLPPKGTTKPCEWRGKANCGGGPHPIVGCINGVQEARHHGPDKNVTNNEEGNVHRICHACHYRWHAANDGTYDWNETLVSSHDPRTMTDEDKDFSLDAYLKYKANKAKRIKD